jgi:signal transduction histidine kinase/CheY-like chemotaxis protein
MDILRRINKNIHDLNEKIEIVDYLKCECVDILHPNSFLELKNPKDISNLKGNLLILLVDTDLYLYIDKNFLLPTEEELIKDIVSIITDRLNTVKKMNEINDKYLILIEKNKQLERLKELEIISSEKKTCNIAFIIHEIKTPLTGIISISEIFLETEMIEEQKEYIQIIYESGKTQLDIIEKGISFTKIDSDKMILNVDEINLNNLLDNSLSKCKIFLKSKNLEFILEKNDDNIVFISDYKKLEQIFDYLLSNAIKFTNKGKIRLFWKVEKKTLFASIRNSGIQIFEKDRAHIFKNFSQLATDYKDFSGYSGTGLSLYIVKNIIQLMSGTINFTSDKNYTDFFFSIPIKTIKDKEVIYELNPFPNCKILLADDNDMSRTTLSTMLLKFGFNNIDIVEDGDEAIEKLSKTKFDIIILDDLMPGKHGVDICLDEKKKNNSQIIIVISAGSVHDRDFKKYKVDEFIRKPIGMEELKQIMFKWSRTFVL